MNRLSLPQVRALLSLAQSSKPGYVRPATASCLRCADPRLIEVFDERLSMFAITVPGRERLAAELLRIGRIEPSLPFDAVLTMEDESEDGTLTLSCSCSWADFVIANPEDEDTLGDVAKLKPGEQVLLGGGATPIMRVRRAAA